MDLHLHRVHFLVLLVIILLQNERLYAATDSNAVESYLFEDGQPDGVLTRFSSCATHICFNNVGSIAIVSAR